MKKQVAILTTFGNWDDSYSLCNVVRNQVIALSKNGYKPILFVLDCFPKETITYLLDTVFRGCLVEIWAVLPTIEFEPYQGIAEHRNIPAHFEKDVAKIVPAYNEHFKTIDVFFCHDIIFQDSFLAYNAALRKFVMQKHQKFYHWIHSGPSIRPTSLVYPIECIYTLPPQSKLVYMNNYDVVRAAEMYGTYPNDVKVVHNSIDFTTLPWVTPIAKEIINKFELEKADVVAVYPLSTTRMGEGGKQLHKAIKIMGFLKKQGMSVKYIIPNAHANAEKEKMAIVEMAMIAKQYGVYDDVIFTSLMGYENGIPYDSVLQLFHYSDIFLFPSVSENCPLVLLEAALNKNLLVLNEDFSPMKDFVGSNAFYFKFDSVTTITNHPQGEDNYYEDAAKIIHSHLMSDREYLAKREIRQKFNLNYIFKNELEPLIYGN